MKQYIFGVDLGGTTVKLGLFTTDGRLMDKWEIPTHIENSGKAILPDIAAALHAKLLEQEISLQEVKGVGLGVPGAVLEDRFVKPCVNLNGWGGNVAEELSTLCGLPVRVVNDANAAALGEMWLGGGKGCRSIVFVTLGTGVGGGIITDGKLLSGIHGSGGEIGHMKVEPWEKEFCGCGKKGCLEQYASATGVVRQTEKLLAERNEPSALRRIERFSAKDVFDCAKAGDPLALEAVAQFGDRLGRGLAIASCVCDPEVFVIGGGVSAAGQIILDKVSAAFRKYAFPAAEETAFALAVLGNDAGICGAARLLLED